MKRKTIVEIISFLFIIFFVHSAVNNYIRIESLKNLLAFYTVHVSLVAWIIVITEAVIASLLIISRTRMAGMVMCLLFMLGMGLTVILTPHYPHDFGGLLNDRTGKQLLRVSAIGSVLALFVILINIKTLKKASRREETPVVFT